MDGMGGNNDQKLPFTETMNRFADRKLGSAFALKGQALPAIVDDVDESGTIVTVSFQIQSDTLTLPKVQCALATDEGTRPVIKKGTKGYVVPADYYMGGITGLGGGTATFTQMPNLATLIFHPTGNTDFSAKEDKDKYEISGDNGVILKDKNNVANVNIGPTSLGPKNVIKAKLVSASGDADAAAKGIPLFGWYENNGAVQVRIT